MSLDENQKNSLRTWVANGLQLNDIQKKLTEEFGIKLTYMDLRFLLSDLEVTPKDAEEPEPGISPSAGNASPSHPLDQEGDPLDDWSAEDQTGAAPGKLALTIDEITRPGFAISGSVTFSDQKKAEWYIDQYGRPGINPEDPGYRPSQEDILLFQVELQKALARKGY